MCDGSAIARAGCWQHGQRKDTFPAQKRRTLSVPGQLMWRAHKTTALFFETIKLLH
jgi:hypothetical protein